MTSFTVSDTPANIATYLNALESSNSKITGITETGTVTITAAQLSADTHALALLNNGVYSLNVTGVTAANAATVVANSHVSSFTVSDTGVNIATYLADLHSGLAHISAINISGTAQLSITKAQQTANADVLAKILGNNPSYTLVITDLVTDIAHASFSGSAIDISDTGANIANNLDTLQDNLAKINSITQSDASPKPALTITEAQLLRDSGILAKLGAYTLNVTDVLAAEVATVLADTNHVSSITVTDTGAHISANWDALQSGHAKITAITQSDASPQPALTITATQLSADTDALAKLNGNYTLNVSDVSSDSLSLTSLLGNAHVTSLDVKDTPAAISANLDALQAINSKIGTINIAYGGTHTPLTLSAAQLTNDAAVLVKIANSDPFFVLSVTDTTANISANIDALDKYAANLTAFVRSDLKAKLPLTITNTQFAKDTGILAKLDAKYTASISDVAINESYVGGVVIPSIVNLLKNTHVINATVLDSSVNLGSNLDALNKGVAKLNSIHVTDTSPIAITAKQFAADTKLLAKIVLVDQHNVAIPASSYTLDVSAVAAGGLAKLVTPVLNNYVPHIHSVSITDTAANVVKNFAVLLADNSYVTGITLSDKKLPVDLKVNVLQTETYAEVLHKMGDYHLAVSDKGDTILTASHLDYLESIHSHITSIVFSKAPTVTTKISADLFNADSDVLNKIKTAFNINIDADNNLLTPQSVTMHFEANIHGAPSVKHFDTVTGWNTGDKITYGSGLIAGHTTAPAAKGLAAIDANGVATFNTATDKTLAQEIAAVEKALGSLSPSTAGQFAMWVDPNGNTDVLIRDGLHTTPKTQFVATAGDELIKLVGTDLTQIHAVLVGGELHFA